MSSNTLKFLSGGGEMGKFIRAHPWADSPLGEPAEWPSTLKTVVRLILTSNDPMLVFWGPEFIQFYNDAASGSLGSQRHPAALGKPAAEWWPEAWHIIGRELEDVMAGLGATWHEDALVPIRRNGVVENVWWTYGYSPIEDDTGVCGVMAICNDVTEQHLGKAMVKESYRALVDSMDEAFCVIDVLFDASSRPYDYRFLEANPTFTAQSGLVDAVGKTILELAGGVESHWLDAYADTALTGEPRRLLEEFTSLNRWFEVYAFRVGTAHGGPVGVLFKDVTQRVQAEKAKQEDDRRKDEFLAMLAHELRNPLAPISAAADLLRLASSDQAKVKRASAVISRQVKHMTGLIDDLLDVSRVTRGIVSLNLQPVEVKHVVLAAIEQVRPLMEARHHVLTIEMGHQPAHVQADENRLVQVFSNVLNNAVKYTPAGGNIHVALNIAHKVSVTIRDDGIGMDPQTLGQAFELFAQAERSSDRAQGGLGIGLALVRSLVQLQGGTVTAQSDGVGKGSQVTVLLPRVECQTCVEVPDAAVPSDPVPQQGRLTILVVDDNTDAAQMLALLVELLGHNVIVEQSSTKALARALQERPDVCLLDIGLPEMDGLELARHLRAEPALARTKLVAVTGYGRLNDREESYAAGFDHHFVKPISAAVLMTVLESVDEGG
ncbi:MAG: response regulator [Rhodoferax sp.]|nr:response regulator [Rhodoferax sp.]